MILKMCKLLNDLFTFFASRFFRFYFDFAVVVFLYKKRSNRIGSIELHLFLILALVFFFFQKSKCQRKIYTALPSIQRNRHLYIHA